MTHSQFEPVLEKPPGLRERVTTSMRAQDFQALRHRRSAEKQLLPFLKTAVDLDIVCEVGFHERTQSPLTVKHLILLGLAPQMTVFRRLNRLCDLGVVTRTRSARDARVHELRLAANIHALLMRCAGGTCDLDAD